MTAEPQSRIPFMTLISHFNIILSLKISTTVSTGQEMAMSTNPYVPCVKWMSIRPELKGKIN